ncbi:hydroxymethylbilane synthase [Fodinisporobacter ferrooxydans]|uniref:Porphobilinogen deaminase n=1 Tax=Fodinisporobacter ferrooxydans TaxID=2901836 RepID=A0ABY4CI26_9BACL|nr:hydroxymethylbilane synthase [Alicyclobacillaceae bacterium MYW30-H2]
MNALRVGTRQSQLALTQTNWVCQQIQHIHNDVTIETVKIVTKGDRILDVALSKVGGKGLFIKEIEQALLDGTVDFAVHSMKDMPAEMPEGLMIGAVPVREDVRDVVIAKDGCKFQDLPFGAVVGTSSLRRSIQLKAARPDLRIVPLRGNIDTRLRKLRDGQEGLDAIVLAAAGLERMGWAEQITERIPVDLCIPAAGQGALAIQCRSDDRATREILLALNDAPTEKAVQAERTFLGRLNGGCQIPIGAHASFVPGEDGLLEMIAIVGDTTGARILRAKATGTDPVQLGHTVADQLFAQGAKEILASVREELNRS